MDIKPVKDAEHPRYPLKTEIDEASVKGAVPKRWTQSATAKVALGTLAAMSLAGCSQPGLPLAAKCSGAPIAVEYVPGGTAEPAVLNIAPLFIHGEGRGAFGCVMVAPPVFLSEYDALAVINEAAKEYGLEFSGRDAPEFSGVLAPSTNIYDSENKKSPSKRVDMRADFFDSGHNISIDFVSVDDVKQWHQDNGAMLSVEEYDTADAAAQLSEALEEINGAGLVAAVLYDPCELYQPEVLSDKSEWEKAEAKTREMSEKQLAAQAKDFFEWLKNQGVI